LVTLDLKMPGLEGGEVLKKIKQKKPDIEVLIVTGYGSLKSAIDGIRHGACDYLIKPFNISDIVNIINKAINKKRKMEELKNFLHDLEHTFEGKMRVEDQAENFKEESKKTSDLGSLPV
jgi:DNA-binding NtrC family response regulator